MSAFVLFLSGQIEAASEKSAQDLRKRQEDDSRALKYDAAAVALQAEADQTRSILVSKAWPCQVTRHLAVLSVLCGLVFFLQARQYYADLKRMAEDKRTADAYQIANEKARQRVCDQGILSRFGSSLK